MTRVMLAVADEFQRAYIACALWSSTDDDDRPMDEGMGPDDIAPATLKAMLADCDRFRAENSADVESDPERAGRDFWLTRNGHGSGFWDGDWPEPAATRLTDAAHACGGFELYIGDDGRIHGI